MRRASERPENDDENNNNDRNLRNKSTSTTATGIAMRPLMSILVATNPRRKVELFLILTIPLFFFYVINSFASSSSSNNSVKSEISVVPKNPGGTIDSLGGGLGGGGGGLLRSDRKTSNIQQAYKSIEEILEEDDEPSVANTPEDPCTIWLAPSSLKGHPGYGLFTTRNLSAGEAVLGGPDGLSIPVEDRWYLKPGELGEKKKKWIHLWNSYWWGRGVPDHVSFEGSRSSADYQIGFGAMPNHHCLLRSLKHRYPETAPYQDSLVNRYRDPGAGAFSYSRGREFTVIRNVPAGGELFMSYGYCSHDGHGPSWTKNIFMPDDFYEAARLVWRQIRHPDQKILFANNNTNSSTGSRGDNDKVRIPPKTDKLVAALLPQDRGEFEHIKSNVDANDRDALAEFLAVYKGLNTKTVDDIRRDGMCMERMKPGHSTIPQAGQGGFAQFKIRKGEMIVPSPVLHIMDKDVLALFDPETGNRTGTQLLINYCFGHEESSVLMCPDTNALLINHCSTRMKNWKQYCPDGPNAEHRWASGWDATSDKWRQMSLDELDQQKERGLALEIFALRNIEPNEEITIDYGEEWEQAWQAFVASWKPPPRQTKTDTTWITATEANTQPMAPIMDDFISHDLRHVKPHEYLFTGCQYRPGDEDLKMAYRIPAGGKPTKTKTNERAPVDWVDLSDEEILRTYATDGSRHRYHGNGYSNHGDNSHYPCAILLPENNTNNDKTYTVRILASPYKKEVQPWEKNDVPRILTNYSRESIHYFVRPYQSDQHLPGVFRHHMGFRKDQFPEQWKNIKHTNLRRHFR